MRPRRVLLAAAFAALLALFGPSYAHHARFAWPVWNYNDDARVHIFPFYRYSEPGAWDHDYLGDYVLEVMSPVAYRGLYTAAGAVGAAEPLSKVLPYLLELLTLVAVAAIARRIGGWPAAFLACVIVLGSKLYLQRMTGGLPRAFAFPIIALGLWAQVVGRPTRLRWAFWAGAAFYPMVSVILGTVLGVSLLVGPRAERGEAADWGLLRRLRFLVVAVLVAALFAAPTLLESKKYGRRVHLEEVANYPEVGPQGTHGPDDRGPFTGYFENTSVYAKDAVVGAGDPWFPAARRLLEPVMVPVLSALFGLVGLAWLALARSREARRFLLALVGVVVAHAISRVVFPYFYSPTRYVLYTGPLLIAVLFASAPFLARGVRGKLAGGALACAALVFTGSHGDWGAGIIFQVPERDRQMYEAVAKTPPGSLIAGWPDDPMSSVPHLSHRKALMTGVMHQAFYTGYLEAVRSRLWMFFEAYLSTDFEHVDRLRRELGVTHILMEHRHFSGTPPGYMEPLGTLIRHLTAERKGRPYYLVEQQPYAEIFRNEKYSLIDLSKIRTSTTTP